VGEYVFWYWGHKRVAVVVIVALTLLVWWQEGHRPVKTEWHGYLSGRGADLHMAQLMPLPLTNSCSSKSRLVLLFWYQFTQVVSVKIQRAVKR